MRLENGPHAGLVQNVRHQRNDDLAMPPLDHFLFDLEQLDFASLHQQQALGTVGGDLPAQLAADAAAGARDQDHPILKRLPDAFGLQAHGFPAQEVFDADRAQLRH